MSPAVKRAVKDLGFIFVSKLRDRGFTKKQVLSIIECLKESANELEYK